MSKRNECTTIKKTSIDELIVAVMLSDFEMDYSQNGKGLLFRIDKRKERYLQNYITENNFGPLVKFIPETKQWRIGQSIMLERIVREWMDNEGNVVAIDPRSLTENTLFVWILLFAYKTKSGVSIRTTLSEDIRKDVSAYFEKVLNVRLFDKGTLFTIKNYHLLLLKNAMKQRPAIEHLELNSLLSENEAEIFKRKVLNEQYL